MSRSRSCPTSMCAGTLREAVLGGSRSVATVRANRHLAPHAPVHGQLVTTRVRGKRGGDDLGGGRGGGDLGHHPAHSQSFLDWKADHSISPTQPAHPRPTDADSVKIEEAYKTFLATSLAAVRSSFGASVADGAAVGFDGNEVQPACVPVLGGLYSANVVNKTASPVFWHDDTGELPLLRGTWFSRSGTASQLTRCAHELLCAFGRACTLGRVPLTRPTTLFASMAISTPCAEELAGHIEQSHVAVAWQQHLGEGRGDTSLANLSLAEDASETPEPVHHVDLPAVAIIWYSSYTVHVVPKT